MLVRNVSMGDKGANDVRDVLLHFFLYLLEITLIFRLNISLVVSEPLQGQWSFHSFARTKTF